MRPIPSLRRAARHKAGRSRSAISSWPCQRSSRRRPDGVERPREAEFFPEGKIKANVIINIGYGDDAKLFPRNPRLTSTRWRRFSERATQEHQVTVGHLSSQGDLQSNVRPRRCLVGEISGTGPRCLSALRIMTGLLFLEQERASSSASRRVYRSSTRCRRDCSTSLDNGARRRGPDHDRPLHAARCLHPVGFVAAAYSWPISR